MDNGATSKRLQENENTYGNPNLNKIPVTKKKSDHKEMCGKQATQNSSSKFDLPSFKCAACPYESIWKHAVKRHQQTHYKGQNILEGNKKQKYKCETCSYTANNWTILKHHQELHLSPNTSIDPDVSQDEEDSSALDETKRKEKQLEENKYNSEQESNKRSMYTCKKCEYKTIYKVVFENHKKVHLPKNEVEVFRCDQCNFNSVYRQSFLRHIKGIHENESSQESDYLQCNYCGLTSDGEEEFEHHMKMHTKLEHSDRKDISLMQDETNFNGKCDGDVHSQNNNLPQKNSQPINPREIISSSEQSKLQTPSQNAKVKLVQKPAARATRRGKYSNVPVKTTKNGLFECEHCSYQTAIRTALVKHQTNHLKNANS